MDYSVLIQSMETDRRVVFLAKYPALKGVSGSGDSPEEALSKLQSNAKHHIQFLKEEGIELPALDSAKKQYHSKAFQVRLPGELHASLQSRSETSGLSMNTIIMMAIQKYLTHEDYLDAFKDFIQQTYLNPRTLVSESSDPWNNAEEEKHK